MKRCTCANCAYTRKHGGYMPHSKPEAACHIQPSEPWPRSKPAMPRPSAPLMPRTGKLIGPTPPAARELGRRTDGPSSYAGAVLWFTSGAVSAVVLFLCLT